MTSTATQAEYLDKILTSKEFSGSKVYQAYLTYLVEASSKGQPPKETTIAFDVFGKEADFNPAEDTIVRSHTYQLRKKLESYYFNQGKEDKYRLEIPKGHYEVRFVEVRAHQKLSLLRRSWHFIVIGLLILAVAALWFRERSMASRLQAYQVIDVDDAIWGDYLQSDLPNLIAVGNHFFFDEFSSDYGQVLGIRHARINSPEDFSDFKTKHKLNELQPTEEPYFPYHSIWSLPPILSLFFSVHEEPILRKSSAISPQMLDEYNMIFLGSIKTLYILKHTLSKSNFSFEISPHKIIYSPPDTTGSQIFETNLHSAGPNDDLVLAVKLPGPVQNSIFIIASFHSLGAPEVAKFLTRDETRAQLESQFKDEFGYMPPYFEILFRVTGIDKTAYNTEILVFGEIPAQE